MKQQARQHEVIRPVPGDPRQIGHRFVIVFVHPKLHVTLRKAYGFGSSLMAMNPFDAQTVTLALPGARLGAMPATSGAEAAGLEADATALLEHAELGGAYSSADTMGYDEVVEPAELRNALLDGLRLSDARRRAPVEPAAHAGVLPAPRHGARRNVGWTWRSVVRLLAM